MRSQYRTTRETAQSPEEIQTVDAGSEKHSVTGAEFLFSLNLVYDVVDAQE